MVPILLLAMERTWGRRKRLPGPAAGPASQPGPPASPLGPPASHPVALKALKDPGAGGGISGPHRAASPPGVELPGLQHLPSGVPAGAGA